MTAYQLIIKEIFENNLPIKYWIKSKNIDIAFDIFTEYRKFPIEWKLNTGDDYVEINSKCDSCNDVGSRDCPFCGGSGFEHDINQSDIECTECGGSGEIICPDCKKGIQYTKIKVDSKYKKELKKFLDIFGVKYS